MSSREEEREFEPPVVRDKRRIDPTTGAVRPDVPSGARPSAAAAGSAGAAGPSVADNAVVAELAERTADLQRLQAEYVNYRRRVERDREAVREMAVMAALVGLLPVLDDIGRARAHGELVGGFKVVADSLEATLSKLGLVAFGESGDPFDPNVHEALLHEFSHGVTEPTCVEVFTPGYKVGERVMRPARVKV
ncbi:MAG TPA: nucleotide exchange factor GrpE, partial [Streptosporangiaceae bacterium]